VHEGGGGGAQMGQVFGGYGGGGGGQAPGQAPVEYALNGVSDDMLAADQAGAC